MENYFPRENLNKITAHQEEQGGNSPPNTISCGPSVSVIVPEKYRGKIPEKLFAKQQSQ
jgi:hypothetical protein